MKSPLKRKKFFFRKSDKVKVQREASAVKRFTRSKAGNVFYFLFLGAFGLFSVLPLIYCVTSSFKPLDEIMIFPPRLVIVVRPTFENYLSLPNLLSNLKIPLSRYVSNSLFVSIITTALYVFISTMAAFVLAKGNLKGSKIIFMIIQFALLYTSYTLAVPQYLVFSKLKLIDTYGVYIFPYLASTMGVFLMKQYIDGYVPNALMEAAEIDGAGYFRIFFQIIIPIVKPCLLTLTLFGFRDVWSAVPQGTIFSEQLKTLPQVMAQITSGGIARSGSAMAVTVIMMIPPILVYMISQSNVVEAMSSAGIKE